MTVRTEILIHNTGTCHQVVGAKYSINPRALSSLGANRTELFTGSWLNPDIKGKHTFRNFIEFKVCFTAKLLKCSILSLTLFKLNDCLLVEWKKKLKSNIFQAMCYIFLTIWLITQQMTIMSMYLTSQITPGPVLLKERWQKLTKNKMSGVLNLENKILPNMFLKQIIYFE